MLRRDRPGEIGRGPGMGRQSEALGGRGKMGGPASGGPGGYCLCPSCGDRSLHLRMEACTSMTCSKCGSRMVRD